MPPAPRLKPRAGWAEMARGCQTSNARARGGGSGVGAALSSGVSMLLPSNGAMAGAAACQSVTVMGRPSSGSSGTPGNGA